MYKYTHTYIASSMIISLNIFRVAQYCHTTALTSRTSSKTAIMYATCDQRICWRTARDTYSTAQCANVTCKKKSSFSTLVISVLPCFWSQCLCGQVSQLTQGPSICCWLADLFSLLSLSLAKIQYSKALCTEVQMCTVVYTTGMCQSLQKTWQVDAVFYATGIGVLGIFSIQCNVDASFLVYIQHALFCLHRMVLAQIRTKPIFFLWVWYVKQFHTTGCPDKYTLAIAIKTTWHVWQFWHVYVICLHQMHSSKSSFAVCYSCPQS